VGCIDCIVLSLNVARHGMFCKVSAICKLRSLVELGFSEHPFTQSLYGSADRPFHTHTEPQAKL
jgi:hypothetical protein